MMKTRRWAVKLESRRYFSTIEQISCIVRPSRRQISATPSHIPGSNRMLVRRPDTVTLRIWSIAVALPDLFECQGVTTSRRHDNSRGHCGNVNPPNPSNKLMLPIRKTLAYVTYKVPGKWQLSSVIFYDNNRYVFPLHPPCESRSLPWPGESRGYAAVAGWRKTARQSR